MADKFVSMQATNHHSFSSNSKRSSCHTRDVPCSFRHWSWVRH